ncbi:hypothetical protein [Jiella avicenniae]|uniref:Uncharacterized protein n=1 Tax=Jiella avicenniae TaxID=2907202 RepID=A0A9X1T3G0_9HYPH|nr:hypothetical protein [Jiella avicenniae]MCE7026424.1 hypothetical protein [Jiella avicenniae]
MREIGGGHIRRQGAGVSYGSGTNIIQPSNWELATSADAATVEAAGYFNALAYDMKKGDIITARIDMEGTPKLKMYIVTARTSTTVTVAKQTVA